MQAAYKTTTYAFVHMLVAFSVSWFVSGSLTVALGISMMEPAIQVGFYYVHEKLWARFGSTATNHHDEAKVSCIAPCCAPTIVEKIKNLRSKKVA